MLQRWLELAWAIEGKQQQELSELVKYHSKPEKIKPTLINNFQL